MRLRRQLLLLALCVECGLPRSAVGQAETAPVDATCAPRVTGLVLGGGGAKGFAHIGVFRVLDSLGIRPDLIVGSSIGAIMGGMYASGYTGREIDSIARALPIADVIRAYSPAAPGVLGTLPAYAVWERGTSGWALQTGSVRESEVNALMSALMLRGNLLARGDFDRLPIPLRVIGTRLSTRTPVVIGAGDLAQAVRASFAIPLLFRPGVIGDEVLMDGGIADNIPVAAARAMGADRVIVSMLPNDRVDDALLGDPFKVALQLSNYLFRNDSSDFRADDVIIRNATTTFNPLDFSTQAIDSLVAGGMREARAMLAQAGCLTTRRQRASAQGALTQRVVPPHVVTAFEVQSPQLLEAQTLRFALGLQAGRRLNEDSLRARLLQLGTSDDYRAIWLTPGPSATDSVVPDATVAFAVLPVRSARQALVLGLAYDNDLGGRIWGGFAQRNLFRSSVEGSVTLDVGKYRQEGRAGLRRRIPAFQRAVPLVASLRTVGEDVLLFTNSAELGTLATRDVEIAAGISTRLARGVLMTVTPNLRTWRTDEPTVGAVGLSLRFVQDSGSNPRQAVLTGEVNTRYQRAHLDVAHRFASGALTMVPRLRAGWSTGAPIHQQFILGGFQGFPGLRTTERRGEQEAMLGFDLARDAYGPVRAIIQLGVGATGTGGGFLVRRADTPSGQIIAGARIGAELRAGVLAIQIARGLNNAGGDVWYVRLGEWF